MSKILGPELMFAKHDKHYPSRTGQTSLPTAVTNFTKPVTKINSGPSIWRWSMEDELQLECVTT